jgi:SAM-dependent methyltransferase
LTDVNPTLFRPNAFALREILFGPYVSSSRIYLRAFLVRAAASVAPDSLVLDAGAGPGTQYRALFDQHRYESADFSGDVTYRGDIASLPVEDHRFDLIVSTQMLEHVPNPGAVLRELFRVLRPSAQLWLTAPLFYEEHEQPNDFFRYTRFGLHQLFENAGFCVEEIAELEGYYATLGYQMAVASRSLPRHPRFYGGGLPGLIGSASAIALRPAFTVLSRLYARLDQCTKFTAAGQCINYCVIGTKP